MKVRQFWGFIPTGKTEKVCFNGWDGKSYNGESEVLPTYQRDCYLKFNLDKRYVPKYTRKWGWTMHEVHYNWDKIGDAYEVDYFCEVDPQTVKPVVCQ